MRWTLAVHRAWIYRFGLVHFEKMRCAGQFKLCLPRSTQAEATLKQITFLIEFRLPECFYSDLSHQVNLLNVYLPKFDDWEPESSENTRFFQVFRVLFAANTWGYYFGAYAYTSAQSVRLLFLDAIRSGSIQRL